LRFHFGEISASAAFSSQMLLPKFLQKQTMLLSENMIPALRITKKHRSACNKQIGALLRVSIGSSCYLLSIYLPLHQKKTSDSSMQMKKSDSPDLDYGRAASALCLLPSHGVAPQWLPFGHTACLESAVLRFSAGRFENLLILTVPGE